MNRLGALDPVDEAYRRVGPGRLFAVREDCAARR
jgi:hypothetical protein